MTSSPDGSISATSAPGAGGVNVPRTISKSRLAASAALNEMSTAAAVPSGTGPPKDPWDPQRELPTRGLHNSGNTCFFNSALQNVFKTRLLHEALFADPERRKGEFIGPMNKALRRVLLEMLGDGTAGAGRKKSGGKHGTKERPYNPLVLLQAVQRVHPTFKGKYQQDAHELFLHLLGTLEDEEDEYNRRHLKKAKIEDVSTGKDHPQQEKGAAASDVGAGGGAGEDSIGGGDGSRSGGGAVDDDEVNTSRTGDDVADASDEGSARSPSSSGETSVDSATPAASTASEEGANGSSETASLGSDTARSREHSSEAVAADVDAVALPAGSTATPTLEGCSRRSEDGPSAQVAGTPDLEAGDEGFRSAGDPDCSVIAPKEGTAKVIAGSTMTSLLSPSTKLLAGYQSPNTPSIYLSSPGKEDPAGGQLVPSITADSVTRPPNPVSEITHDDRLAPFGRETDDSVLTEQEAADTTKTAATVRASDVGTQGRPPSFGEKTADSKRSTHMTESSDSRCKRTSSKDDPSVGQDGDEESGAGTDDDGETTDEGNHEDDDGSGTERVTASATAAAAATDALGRPLSQARGVESSSEATGGSREDSEQEHEKQEEEGVSRAKIAQGERVVQGEGEGTTAPILRKSAVAEVFGGQLCSVVTCGRCSARSFSTEPTVCLNLEIPVQKKVATSTTALRKAAADAKQAAINRKGSTGRLAGLADFELSAKEKRKRARMERERSRQKLQEAGSEAARKKANCDGESKPDGAGAETPEKSGSTVVTLAEAPAAANDRKEEVRNCLEYIVRQACTTSGQDDGVLKKTLGAGKPPVVAAAASPTDTSCNGSAVTDEATLDTDTRVAVATAGDARSRADQDESAAPDSCTADDAGETAMDVSLRKSLEDGVCHPLHHNQKTLTAGEAVLCGDRECEVAGPTLDPLRSGGGDSAEKSAGKETTAGSGSRGGNSNDGAETEPAPADAAKRNSGAAKAARGVSGDSNHSSVGCTTGAAADTDITDGVSGTSSAFGSAAIDGVMERIVEDTRQKSTGAAAAGVVDDADCPSVTAASTTPVILEPDSLHNAESVKTHSSPASCVGSKAAETGVRKTSGGADPPAGEAKNSDNGSEEQGRAAHASPCSTNTSYTATDNPSLPTPPTPAVATSIPVVDAQADADESPLSHLLEPSVRKREPEMRRGVGPSTGIDLYACLDHFVAEEELLVAEGNGYDCEKCRKQTAAETGGRAAAGARDAAKWTPGCEGGDSRDATEEKVPAGKQDARKRILMLGEPPGVLVCHLKRLQAQSKVRKHVEFPIDLDMAPYFWRNPKAPLSPSATCYRLFGIVQHIGNRAGGHYVAYVREGDVWKHASDSDIRESSLPELKKSEAYMLFYERCDKDPASAPPKVGAAEETTTDTKARHTTPDPAHTTNDDGIAVQETQKVKDNDDDDDDDGSDVGLSLDDMDEPPSSHTNINNVQRGAAAISNRDGNSGVGAPSSCVSPPAAAARMAWAAAVGGTGVTTNKTVGGSTLSLLPPLPPVDENTVSSAIVADPLLSSEASDDAVPLLIGPDVSTSRNDVTTPQDDINVGGTADNDQQPSLLAPSMVEPPPPPPVADAEVDTAADGDDGGVSVAEVGAVVPAGDIEQPRRCPQMPNGPAAVHATTTANIASGGEESLQEPVLMDEGGAVE